MRSTRFRALPLSEPYRNRREAAAGGPVILSDRHRSSAPTCGVSSRAAAIKDGASSDQRLAARSVLDARQQAGAGCAQVGDRSAPIDRSKECIDRHQNQDHAQLCPRFFCQIHRIMELHERYLASVLHRGRREDERQLPRIGCERFQPNGSFDVELCSSSLLSSSFSVSMCGTIGTKLVECRFVAATPITSELRHFCPYHR
jgi:hypothetical protein